MRAGRDGDDPLADTWQEQGGEREAPQVVGPELQLEAVGRAGVRVCGGIMTPALLTSTSTGAVKSSANARIEDRSARSSRRTSTWPVMPAAASRPLAVSRTASTTCAPLAAK
ncbi:hypothetical protein ACFV4N_15675 [Actinosynnema sp. NPDC059797]